MLRFWQSSINTWASVLQGPGVMDLICSSRAESRRELFQWALRNSACAWGGRHFDPPNLVIDPLIQTKNLLAYDGVPG